MFEFQDLLNGEKIIVQQKMSSKFFLILAGMIFFIFGMLAFGFKMAGFFIIYVRLIVVILIILLGCLGLFYYSVSFIITNMRVILFFGNFYKYLKKIKFLKYFFRPQILKYSELLKGKIYSSQIDEIFSITKSLEFISIKNKDNNLIFYLLDNPQKILKKAYHYFL